MLGSRNIHWGGYKVYAMGSSVVRYLSEQITKQGDVPTPNSAVMKSLVQMIAPMIALQRSDTLYIVVGKARRGMIRTRFGN
jgi:hypothetical protein